MLDNYIFVVNIVNECTDSFVLMFFFLKALSMKHAYVNLISDELIKLEKANENNTIFIIAMLISVTPMIYVY